MELTWQERYLIIALRITFPFFRREGFALCAMEYGFIDGDYLVYRSIVRKIKISITYNPLFDIIIHRNRILGQHENISLVLEKMKYQEYAMLPETNNINDEYDLRIALMGYLEFLKKYYLE